MIYLACFYLGAGAVRGWDYWQSHCSKARYDKLRWKIALTILAGLLWLPVSLAKLAAARAGGLVWFVLWLSAAAQGATIVVDQPTPTHIQGRVIDAAGSQVAILAKSDVRITDCRIRGAKVLFQSETPIVVVIENCVFEDCLHAVHMQGPGTIIVRWCLIRDWLGNAVWIDGTKEGSPRAIIDGNLITDPKAGKGGPRYPIFVNNRDRVANIVGLRITNNRVVGSGETFDRDSPTSRGTADQISVYFAVDFVISGNESIDGGENGISVTLDSNRGIVSANIVRGCDKHGIQIGSLNATDKPDVTDVLVVGNLCDGNGLGQDGTKVLAGIYLQDAERVTVANNQITGSHKRGILVAVSDYFALRANTVSGPSISVQVDQTKVLHYSKSWAIDGPAVINSTADPIVLVDEDDVTLSQLTINGRFKSDGLRQRGVHSDRAKRCKAVDCSFQGMTNGMKLDLNATDWEISDCQFSDLMGVSDGFGYGILVGVGGSHRITDCVGRGSPGRGRHFVYLSGGASDCTVTNCRGSGFNSSTFAVYSKSDQPPCSGNTFERCTARNQLTGHDGTNGGAPEAAAFELTGRVVNTTIRDCSASDIAVNGVIVNTLGLDAAEVVSIDRLILTEIKGKGVFLIGSRKCRIENSRGDVEIHPWWRTAPKRAAEDIAIANLTGNVTINPTKPQPKRVTRDGKVLAP